MIKALIVDDSKFIHHLFDMLIKNHNATTICDDQIMPFFAFSADEARTKLDHYEPDVMTLDINMPSMDGITFLKEVMQNKPLPIVMISSYTQENSKIAIEALSLGAVDYMAKPTIAIDYEDNTKMQKLLIGKIIQAASANVARYNVQSENAVHAVVDHDANALHAIAKPELILIIGAMGAVEPVVDLIANLKIGMPPIVITLDLMQQFIPLFASKLNSSNSFSVHLVRDKMRLEDNNIYINSSDDCLSFTQEDMSYYISIEAHNIANKMDKMLLAAAAKKKVLAIALSGAGIDGIAGMIAVINNDGIGIVQSPATAMIKDLPAAILAADHRFVEMDIKQILHVISNCYTKL